MAKASNYLTPEKAVEITKSLILSEDMLIGYMLVNSEFHMTSISAEKIPIIRATVGITHKSKFDGMLHIFVDNNYIQHQIGTEKRKVVKRIGEIFIHEILHVMYKHVTAMHILSKKLKDKCNNKEEASLYMYLANIIADLIVNEKALRTYKWTEFKTGITCENNPQFVNLLKEKFGGDIVEELKITPLAVLKLSLDEAKLLANSISGQEISIVESDEELSENELEQAVTTVVRNAITAAKMQGYDNADLLLEIESQFVYKPPWDLKFTKVFDSTIQDEYTLTKLNQQYAMASEIFQGVLECEDIIVGSLTGEICKCAIAIDSSGSMISELPEYLEKIGHIISIKGMKEIYVVSGDVASYEIGTFQLPLSKAEYDFILKNIKGGGGTDFRPLFEKVEEYYTENRDTFAAMILLTDTYGTFPEKPPKFRTIVVTYENPHNIPDWVEVVDVSKT